jgi:hypothetical protein
MEHKGGDKCGVVAALGPRDAMKHIEDEGGELRIGPLAVE